MGDPADANTRALMDVVRRCYEPSAVVIPVAPDRHAALAGVLPWLGSMVMQGGRATAYLCGDSVCQAPTTSPRDLAAQLQRR